MKKIKPTTGFSSESIVLPRKKSDKKGSPTRCQLILKKNGKVTKVIEGEVMDSKKDMKMVSEIDNYMEGVERDYNNKSGF